MKIKTADILKEVSSRKDEIIRWAQKLISFPTENKPPDGFEGQAQQFLAKECSKIGLDVDMFSPDEVPKAAAHPWWLPGRNYSNNRKNMVAAWKGDSNGRSILFSGHMDVAPSSPGKWEITPPFKPLLKEGKLYGRGSADLKGGMAACFWAIKILKEMGFRPSGNILFESVVDEEFAGGNGTLASRLKGHNADLAILVEPTRMQVCPACMGAFLGEIILTGTSGMPYMGFDIPNPIFGAAAVIDLFKKWGKNWTHTNRHPLFEEEGKELKVLLWDIDSKIPGEFTQMGTPLRTRFSWIVWCYPGTGEEDFKDKFLAFWDRKAADENLKPFKLEHKFTYHYIRPWETDPKNPAVQEVVNSFNSCTGQSPVVGGAPFSCDMAIYGEIGNMPVIILGPRGGNLHAPDEWVLAEDILSLAGIFIDLSTRWVS
ncbi:MAG: M20 family metallopeptidase [Actinomycetota bacterium]